MSDPTYQSVSPRELSSEHLGRLVVVTGRTPSDRELDTYVGTLRAVEQSAKGTVHLWLNNFEERITAYHQSAISLFSTDHPDTVITIEGN